MDAGNTRLDRTFRGDSKHPNRNFSTNQSPCNRCGDGVIAYDIGRGESRCQVCDMPL